jgi:antitoxin MazE
MVISLSEWGNGRAVKLPQKVLKEAKISIEDNLEIIIEDKKITLQVTNKLPALAELLDGWDGTPPEPFDWGEPVGRELL